MLEHFHVKRSVRVISLFICTPPILSLINQLANFGKQGFPVNRFQQIALWLQCKCVLDFFRVIDSREEYDGNGCKVRVFAELLKDGISFMSGIS